MKSRITIVVLGHVDHGKSTLVGRYLLEKGLVNAEEIERNATVGAEMGKASFKYAWVMDRSDESRRRGLTLDLNFADVETRKREIHIIDAPGHRDFVRSMITGTTGADAALLVVDAMEGIMPQTREHAQLAKLMGVERVVVALNKIDKVGYDAASIETAAADMRGLLEGMGIAEVDIIPVSAWEGQNLTSRGGPMSWYKGRTLEEVLDSVEPRGAPTGGSLRMPVMQVLQIGGVGTVVLGRVERGEISEGDELLVMPANKLGIVRSIEAYGKKLKKAEAGETIGVALRDIGKLDVFRGDVLGPMDDAPQLVEDFTAKIVLIGDAGVVKPGWAAHIHCHTTDVPVRLEAIEMKLSSESGMATDGGKDAGFLVNGDAAIVRMKPLKPLIIEPAEALPGMARFALRAGKVTLGAGSCTAVRVVEKRTAAPKEETQGFSYKWQKTGKAARDEARRKQQEKRDASRREQRK